MDIIITGASRGIGRALALALSERTPGHRLVLVARHAAQLEDLVQNIQARGGQALAIAGDLSSRSQARALGLQLTAAVEPGATLVHNAGLWPRERVASDGGLEQAFVVNHLGPVLMQAPLLEQNRLARVLAVSAGFIAFGRFDALLTPTGADFSRFRTYATTKLCFAIAMRRLAAQHPDLDVLVLHPGVVRTDLGALPGLRGRLLQLVKRLWESPERCAARLVRILERPRWSTPGQARWWVEERERAWPASASHADTERAVHEITARLLEV
jgi:NAD(P)-dependent dehydrogenase (short-subunit alcohol dehydrogenase family)